jgi:membrane protein implicated in regulation of membrane protease activity
MGESLQRWFLPGRMRFLPGSRAISIALRTLHLIAFGVLLGGHAFNLNADRLLPYLWVTIGSGLGLIALEVHAVGLYWLVLGKGIMVLAKLAVLLLIPFFWEARVPLLLLVVGIASVGSHMPARYRHYSLLDRREIEPGESLRRAVVSASTVAVEVTGRRGRAVR